ncbi:MAG: AAA family ATPase [Verrucomicrobiota bacterium]
MYKDFYGLREYPFNMTPDPQFFFQSRTHRVALDVLRFGIRERKGFLVITGEIGAGKTTVCRSLLRSLDANTKTALLLNPCVSDSQILRTVCDEFKLQPAKTTKKDLYDTINAFLIRELAANHNVVLIVDEAQNLRPKALEQIRLLSNLETEKEKLLQIILVGQPELAKLLQRDDLVQLKQRIALRHHIPPLEWEEIGEYIRHRLEVAGDARIQWTDGALLLIRRYSRGVPRLINVVCDKALMAGYVAESFLIDAGFVQRGIEDIEGEPIAEELKVGVE